MLTTSLPATETEEKSQKILLMKKSPNLAANWGEKIEKWEWSFDRRVLIKNLLTQ